ncbi:ATP-binding protein [Devosia sp. 66-22]|uniref:AAA family ATPase n=1 Tax=Devosia sp. 66-22 TaxID=1895753 RepID=UPI0026241E3F|nr:ATP-binding protein [Devosia sp. 66-22]
MLRSIEIKRFKSIVNQSVSFGRVNLFVGGNGSGKSNLLEALGMVSAALGRGITDIDLVAKGIRLSPPSLFKSAFKNRDLPRTFRLESHFTNDVTYSFDAVSSETATSLSFHSERATWNEKSVFGRSGNGATVDGASLPARPIASRGMYDQVRSLVPFPTPVVEALDSFGSYAIYSPQTEFLRGTEVGTAQQPPVGLHGEGLPQAMASLLSDWGSAEPKRKSWIDEIFNLVWSTGWTNQFGVGSPGALQMSTQIKTGDQTLYFRDRFMHAERNRVTAYDASEGVLFLTFMVILLAHKEAPPIFALDNVDSALNPRMTQYAVSSIVDLTKESEHSRERQVFMTSHNPTAMDAIDIFDDATRIFTVSRGQDGYSQVTRIRPPDGLTREQWIAKKAGRSMSELWLAGEIPGALGEVRF